MSLNNPSAPNQTSFNPDEPKTVIPSNKPKSGNIFRDILSIISVLAGALALAFFLISFVFQSYQVDGPSMQSTLQDQDHLIVWKVPKTLAKISGQHYIPQRYDIIVFDLPASMNEGHEQQLIKRVIGLPGDRVVVKDHQVTVYNGDFPDGFNPDQDQAHGSLTDRTSGNADITVGKNEVFVLGDHRKNSKDSRSFGAISSDIIVGKLILRVLPLNTTTRF